MTAAIIGAVREQPSYATFAHSAKVNFGGAVSHDHIPLIRPGVKPLGIGTWEKSRTIGTKTKNPSVKAGASRLPPAYIRRAIITNTVSADL
jgi:hypothetical protein